MTAFFGAVQFVTRIPVRVHQPVPIGRCLPWLPIVGAFIGGVVGAVAVTAALVLAPLPAAAVAVVAGLLITGAFHEDGLADIADAFGGGWNVEQRLDILKDSRHGTYGVAALCSSIMIRVAAVASIAAVDAGWPLAAALIAAHTLGRGGAVVVTQVAPLARQRGLGFESGTAMSVTALMMAVGATVMVVGVVAGWAALVMIAVATGAAVAVTTLAIRKIGGVVGDVLGAVEQVIEGAVLLVAAALLTG